MPESPVAQKFSAAPPGKTALTAAEMQAAVTQQFQQVAQVLGGQAVGTDGVASAPVQAEKEEPFKINDDDKRSYLRSLLAKEPFTKLYSLFGGRLRVAFRTRKTSENETILKSSPDLKERHKQRLACSVLGMTLGDIGKTMEPVTLGDLDDISHSATSAAFNEFEELCDELFRRANDPDFWTETAGLT